jgi:hypothetical protein
MKTEDRFPHEKCVWGNGDPDKQRRWLDALEKTGPANVRARLAHIDYGSAACIAIGTEHDVTIGFAQEWLAWHDRRASERETKFRTNQIFWTRWAAIAASVAASAAAIGWIVTLLRAPH